MMRLLAFAGAAALIAVAAVTPAKAQRLRRLAERWLQAHEAHAGGIRIDVVGVLLAERGASELQHLRGVG